MTLLVPYTKKKLLLLFKWLTPVPSDPNASWFPVMVTHSPLNVRTQLLQNGVAASVTRLLLVQLQWFSGVTLTQSTRPIYTNHNLVSSTLSRYRKK